MRATRADVLIRGNHVIDAIPPDNDDHHVTRRAVCIVAFDGMQPLDAIGPHEVFAGATAVLAADKRVSAGYDLTLVSLRGLPTRVFGVVAGLYLMQVFVRVVIPMQTVPQVPASVPDTFGTVAAVGDVLFRQFMFPFEAISLQVRRDTRGRCHGHVKRCFRSPFAKHTPQAWLVERSFRKASAPCETESGANPPAVSARGHNSDALA